MAPKARRTTRSTPPRRAGTAGYNQTEDDEIVFPEARRTTAARGRNTPPRRAGTAGNNHTEDEAGEIDSDHVCPRAKRTTAAPGRNTPPRRAGQSGYNRTEADSQSRHGLAYKDRIVTILVPGSGDPASILKEGKFEISWSAGGTTHKVKKFIERPARHVVDASLTLPTLYLHFLAQEFFAGPSEMDPALRAGNDNAELRIVLPEVFMDPSTKFGLTGELHDHLQSVLHFLREQGQVQVSAVRETDPPYKAVVCPERVGFGLQTARPKAPVNLDKPSFGIPNQADLYLFVFNHSSVGYMSEAECLSFETCIEELPSHGDRLKRFSIFLKVFYEGAFGYNQKTCVGEGGRYLPKNVGIACMSVVPAFPNQVGIATGYPYLLESRFMRFADSIPVTIRTISRMSDRHKRYGLCFTRCVFVWAGEGFEQGGWLDFCSILPHGGFFYLPGNLADHRRLGGFVYAFGDDRNSLERPAKLLHDVATARATIGKKSIAEVSPATTKASSAGEKPEKDHVCVICLDSDAVLAALPCGHLAFCQGCAELARGRSCPICRGTVASVVRIYM